MIYLDNAATTLQKPVEVRRRMLWAMEHCANPGRGGHEASLRAANLVYRARETAAALFEARPEQVVFTMNATHGLNLAIHSLVKPGARVLISGYEHNAVLRPLYGRNAELLKAACSPFDGAQCFRAFEAALEKRPAAVIVNHVSNVFGFVQPIEQIAALCRRKGVPLIVDASQSAGVLPLSFGNLGAAFLAMPGHKGLYGPQGTGLLLCGDKTVPLLYGGTGSRSTDHGMPEELPERLEAGTLNVPGIAGLLAGMEFIQRNKNTILRHELKLKTELCRQLSDLSKIRLFSDEARQLGVVSFQPEGFDCEDFAKMLADRGIAVRAGLHCAPEAHRSAGTLEQGTVRVSVSAFTSPGEIRSFVIACEEILKKQA